MIAIYKISSPSGKIYIGQTCRVNKRITQYRNLQCKGQPGIYRSLLKYGWDQHVFEIVHQLPDDCDQNTVNEYEILYYELYLICGVPMLNMMGPGIGGKVSDEVKEKIRQKAIGRKHKPETLLKIAKINLGKKFSIDHKNKLSTANKGKGGRISFAGKQHSNETKNRMSAAQKGKPKSREHCKSMSIAQAGVRNREVIQCDLNGNEIKTWVSIKEAGEHLNISKGNISRCANNKIGRTGKYKWKFKLWQ